MAGALDRGLPGARLGHRLALSLLVGIIIIGGLKRIAGFTEKIVPFMSVFYLLGCLAVIVVHGKNLPGCLEVSFSRRFSFRPRREAAPGLRWRR